MRGTHVSLVRHPIRTKKRLTPAHEQELHDALERLVEILPAEGWELGGGVALDATLGSFRRYHGDVDINVHRSRLPDLVEAASRHGYALRTYVFWTQISPSHELCVTRDLDVATCETRRLQRLHFMSTSPEEAPPLLVAFDVAVYLAEGDAYVRLDRKIEIPKRWWRWGEYRTLNGSRVPLSHPRHLLAIKRRRAHPLDRSDRRLLEAWLAEHPEAS